MAFVFVSVSSSFTTSSFKSACVFNVHIHVWRGMLQFPGGKLRFYGVVRNVLCFSLIFPFYTLFPGAGYVCVRSGMLLLPMPILFQRYLGCRPWSFKFFEKYSISVLRSHTVNAVSWCRSVGHDGKLTSSARIPILDPALLVIVPNIRLFGCLSNVLRKVSSVELCDPHEAFLPPGHFQKDSLVLERLSVFIFLFSSRLESIHVPMKYVSFQLRRMGAQPINSVSIGIPPGCPWIARK